MAGETRPGIEVLLADSIHLVEGLRAGLVTNHTGIDRQGVSTIDLLHGDGRVELVALYSPEHGIRGEAEAGELVDSGTDPRTGLPIHSLYAATRKPTPEMLEGVEVLLFDIQDIGARYYTYVYTMALAMEAAGEAGIPFVVLDRPNPIGGVEVQGNVLDPAFASFVGMYAIPMRHGMTPGSWRVFSGTSSGWRRNSAWPRCRDGAAATDSRTPGFPGWRLRRTCLRWRAPATIRAPACSKAPTFPWAVARPSPFSRSGGPGWTGRCWPRT